MYTITPVLIGCIFLWWEDKVFTKNREWFATLKKPKSYPIGMVFGAITVAYSALDFAAIIIANSEDNSLACWSFIARLIISAIMTDVMFRRQMIFAATIINCTYYVATLAAIMAYWQTSAFAAGIVVLMIPWIVYTIYAGFYMAQYNVHRA